MIFAIIHDLGRRADYTPLFERIKALGDWMHYIESLWIIQTRQPTTAAAIYRELEPYIHPSDDYLLIIEVKRNYFGILPKEAWDWLNNRNWEQASLPLPTL
ncbi:MAG TPA: hypothetical protein VNN21_08490 [Dehalococcoidia bacterium]|nr:hypothetical protein [Dehalococcoidia bacterium]